MARSTTGWITFVWIALLMRTLPAGSPTHAQAGERWTFTVRSMHGGPEGTETWEVLEVDSGGVRYRVTPLGEGAREQFWQYAPRVRSEEVLRVWQEPLTISGRTIDCEVVEVIDGSSGGLDNMRVWIAVDRTADAPTFPGVVRIERVEFRGRTMVEWEVASVAAASTR